MPGFVLHLTALSTLDIASHHFHSYGQSQCLVHVDFSFGVASCVVGCPMRRYSRSDSFSKSSAHQTCGKHVSEPLQLRMAIPEPRIAVPRPQPCWYLRLARAAVGHRTKLRRVPFSKMGRRLSKSTTAAALCQVTSLNKGDSPAAVSAARQSGRSTALQAVLLLGPPKKQW